MNMLDLPSSADPVQAPEVSRTLHIDRAGAAQMLEQARATHRALPPAVPLYLAGRTTLRVYLEGPSLLVRGRGRVTRRYPLARISLVIVSGRVEWATNALLECMEKNVPVVFLDAQGLPKGHCLGAHSRPTRLANLLEEFLDRPDWNTHYDNWLRAAKSRVLKSWRRGDEAWMEHLQLMNQFVYCSGRRAVFDGPETVYEGFIAAQVVERLNRLGLKPAYTGFGEVRLELASDLGLLNALALKLRLALERSEEPPAHAFERRSHWLSEHCGRHMHTLAKRAREVLEGAA